MKRLCIIPSILLMAVFLIGHQVHGRGPGGGGRGGGGGMARPSGGGGGMARPSGGMGHSPSFGGGNMGGMPAQRPSPGAGAARPNPGAGAARPNPGGAGRPGGVPSNALPGGAGVAGGRPSAGQLDKFLDMPRPSTGGISGNDGLRPGAGGAAGDFLRNEGRPGQLPVASNRLPGANANRPAATGERRQNVSDNRAGRIDNRQEWQGNREQRRDEVRNQVQENHPRLDFWSDHPNWAAWRINRPYRWATWAAVGAWVGGGWSEPASYSYGEEVYYDNGQVYYGDQAVATSEDYAQQAADIAASAPQGDIKDSEWMSLGVFALTQDGQATGPDPSLYMQLAISKQGEISGTLKNTVTGQTQTLEGMADKKSQRVAWTVKDKKYPIVETGIGNLTKDSAPALLHFEDGQTQQWLMVHLEEPKEQQQ